MLNIALYELVNSSYVLTSPALSREHMTDMDGHMPAADAAG